MRNAHRARSHDGRIFRVLCSRCQPSVSSQNRPSAIANLAPSAERGRKIGVSLYLSTPQVKARSKPGRGDGAGQTVRRLARGVEDVARAGHADGPHARGGESRGCGE